MLLVAIFWTFISLIFDGNKQEFSDSHPPSHSHSDASPTVNTELKCKSVGSCKAIKRLIIALKWYENCAGNYDALIAKVKESTYDKYILDDYQHILNHHLIQEYHINSSKEYQLIQNEISKQVEPCDVNYCSGFKRFSEVSKKNLSKSADHEFCMDFMDLIHCYLMHLDHLH